MNREELHKIISGSRLPARVKKYISAFADSGADSWLKYIFKAAPVSLLANISSVMEQAAANLGLSPEEVLFATGFHPGNLAPERLEAALAELLAVNFLAREGFSSISSVPQSRSKTADITAARGGSTYAFEVRCVTRDSGFSAVDFIPDAEGRIKEAGQKALPVLEKKYRKKMPQAACSRKKNNLSHCGLIFVVNSSNFAPFAESEGLTELAAALYKKVGSPERQHLCLLSGGETGVFPAWKV